MIFLCLLIAVSAPLKLAASRSESVDLIELNHLYDNKGRPSFDQVVFYERSPATGRFQVRAWCMVDDREELSRRPVKSESTGLWVVDWQDKDNRITRRITSRLYRESWTHFDPEREDKKRHDERLRVALSGPIRGDE